MAPITSCICGKVGIVLRFSCLDKGSAVVFLICGCPSYTVVSIILGRYKNDILNEDKDNLRVLFQTQKHDQVRAFSLQELQ